MKNVFFNFRGEFGRSLDFARDDKDGIRGEGRLILFFLTAILAGVFLLPKISLAAIELVKSKNSSTVYYLDSQGIRHPFPNIEIYESWYGRDFSKITNLSSEEIAKYPLGKNITMRPGKKLVKFPSRPEVYVVLQGGVLRHIEEEDTAENIYGRDWAGRVVDVSEVFFGDYIIGESIRHIYTIPDNVVYKLKNENKYYWKTNSVLQPFKSFDDVLANGYDADDVVAGERHFYSRRREIFGQSPKIFNPAAEPAINNEDCESKNLKAAFVYINLSENTTEQINKLQTIKKEFANSFSWATNELAKIDTEYPIVVILGDDKVIDISEDGNRKLTNEIAYDFFDNNPDEFDFIFLFTDFNVMTGNEIANYTPVTNKLFGLNKARLDASEIYGSYGKLKGIINMGNLNKYKIGTTHEMNMTQNYMLHEIAHHWSGAVQFENENGELSNDLLREPDLLHWSYYAGFVSPLGGSGWQDNHDGTFTSLVSQMTDSNRKKYADLDLYLMGLLPAQVIEPIMYVVPSVEGEIGNTISGEAKYVDIEQIIEANGKWRCER